MRGEIYMIRDFLIQYWPYVLAAVVIFVVIPLYLVVRGKWTELRRYAYRVIKVAEDNITGTKLGMERFNFVLDEIYKMVVPAALRPLIPKSTVARKLQLWFYDVKDYLDDGKVNKSLLENLIIKPPPGPSPIQSANDNIVNKPVEIPASIDNIVQQNAEIVITNSQGE